MSDKSGQNDPQMQDILGSIRRIISEDNAQPAGAAAEHEDEEILELTEEVEPDEADVPRLDPNVGAMPVEPEEPEVRREPILGLHRPAPQPPAEVPAAPAQEEMAAAPDEGDEIQIPAEMMQEMEAPMEEAPRTEPEPAPAIPEPVAQPAPTMPEPMAQPAPMAREETVREIVSETTTVATATALGELTRAMDEKTNKLKVGPGDTTISDMVKEMLRPMLREWLDENLPGIVERVVRREIQKLVDRAEAED